MTRFTPAILMGALAASCVPRSSPLLARAPSAEPSGAPGPALAWSQLNPATFERARAERRVIVVDGSAEWCHWCHVMEATTYHDPNVRRVLDAGFVAVKVDIDANPDFEERYREWGWPATVFFSAEGAEIGRYKGYLPPERFLEVLKAATLQVDATPQTVTTAFADVRTISEQEVAALAARTEQQLEALWDPDQGSWGREQKVPLHWDNAWTLMRARAGDATARRRLLFTLEQQMKIIDPVWGGICQYSTDGDWLHPHHEKLAPLQAGAIEDYASAFALTRDERWLREAQLVRGFVDRFLTSAEGAHYATMDADLNAHDAGKRYVTGHDYYAKGDAERLALGIPRVDTHEYGNENGLLIASYVTLFEASGDATALASARRSADRVLATHAGAMGGITHGVRAIDEPGGVLYLADNAAFGFALARLYEVSRDGARLDSAKRIADFIVGELFDAQGGAFFASTPDPQAVGSMKLRRKPFEDNVMAIRFLAKLARLLPTDAYRGAISRTLAVVGSPESTAQRGRMVGDLLLAIEETRGLL